MLSLCANISTAVLGIFLGLSDQWLKRNKQLFLHIALGIGVVFGGGIMYIYYWMHKNTLVPAPFVRAKSASGLKSMGFLESLKFVFSSWYIAKIGIIVVCYGVAMNLMEMYYLNIVNLFWLECKTLPYA